MRSPGGTCRHTRVNKSGSNQYYILERRADCNHVLKKERRGSSSRRSEKKSASNSSMTQERLAEYMEFQEFQKWKKDRRYRGGDKTES